MIRWNAAVNGFGQPQPIFSARHTLAKHGKLCDAKPEAVDLHGPARLRRMAGPRGMQKRSMLVRLQTANQWKRWDRKA